MKLKDLTMEHDMTTTTIKTENHDFLVIIYKDKTVTDVYGDPDVVPVMVDEIYFEDLQEVVDYTGYDVCLSDFGYDTDDLACRLLDKYSDMDFADYDQEQAFNTVLDLVEYFGYNAADRYLMDFFDNGSPLPAAF